jgi:hypothetical protein
MHPSYNETEKALIKQSLTLMITILDINWNEHETIDSFLAQAMEKVKGKDEEFYHLISYWKTRMEHITANTPRN